MTATVVDIVDESFRDLLLPEDAKKEALTAVTRDATYGVRVDGERRAGARDVGPVQVDHEAAGAQRHEAQGVLEDAPRRRAERAHDGARAPQVLPEEDLLEPLVVAALHGFGVCAVPQSRRAREHQTAVECSTTSAWRLA